MYAVIECGGAQYRVSEKQNVVILRIDAKQGEKVRLEKVLLVSNGKDVVIGTPVVKDAVVEATIIGHPRSAKIDGMRYVPKKDYRRRWGAHTNFTELHIETVSHPTVKPLAGEAQPAKPAAKPKRAVKAKTKTKAPAEAAAPEKATKAKTTDKGGKK
ncbi:MAG: 50S ribosomal protein L21 [Candidatus Edwardsbacteria bacterium]|jgi:large subunit ribosomal protein L21|nr:50S ribosomal protein L21 [Candidatus Edwardsbacteria bacterium]